MRYSVLFLLFLFAGCIPAYKLSRPHLIYHPEKGITPPLNIQSVAAKNEVIYTEYEYNINPAVKLDQNLHTKYRDVPANVRLSKMRKGKQEIYGTVSISDRSVTYLRDRDGDGKFDQILVQARKNATNWTDITPKVSYHKVKGLRSEKNGVQLDIIYKGLKNKAITVSYRAYRQTLTTPSSVIEKKYSLKNSGDNIFTVKGAKIKVIAASTDTLRYEVVHRFSE